jgi:hypothetical protein
MIPPLFTRELISTVPAWLTRAVGEATMRSFGDQLDALARRVAHAVRQRFPADIDDSSLARIGRERRIRRGPGEDAQTYARRLRIWWDMHRIRGGPYALLWNLHHFFLDWLPGRKDVLDYRGKLVWIDAGGTITRDAITWTADGSAEWAQFWVFFYVPDVISLPDDLLATLAGEILTTLDGDPLATTSTILPGSISPVEAEIFCAIPREWSAAHVKRIHVVLLWDIAHLWEYPDPAGTWATWDARDTAVAAMTWSDWDAAMPTPIVLTSEGL